MGFLFRNQFVRGIFFLFPLLIILAALFFFFLPMSVTKNGEGVDVWIPKGEPVYGIAERLKTHSVIRSKKGFYAGTLLLRVSKKLQAGTYHFEGKMSLYQVIRKLQKGDVVYREVTIPEGWTAKRIAGLLFRQVGIDSVEFLKYVHDPSFCRVLGIEAESLEGYLYPNTYQFTPPVTAQEILQRMVEQFHAHFSDSLKARAREMGWTVHQVVTLASIIEGEAKFDEERPIISAVYHNRLRIGMALQACPTIQYLLPDGPRHLFKKDLEIRSPYNTYLHPGLPPGPVCNPGIASLKAALYPAPVNYLYMVSNGDGSHTFSLRLEEHVKAKHRLNQLRHREAL